MFEKWAEISKGKPDWPEVPVDAELLEKASARLKELGTTMEKAVVLLLTRMIEHGAEMLQMKEAGEKLGSKANMSCEHDSLMQISKTPRTKRNLHGRERDERSKMVKA